MSKEHQPHQFESLTHSIELLIRQNNKLNAHNLELLQQQESMQAEMKNIQQTLERLSAVTNYTPLPLRTAKLSDHFNVLNRSPLFKKQNTHVANSLQA